MKRDCVKLRCEKCDCETRVVIPTPALFLASAIVQCDRLHECDGEVVVSYETITEGE